MDRRLAAITVLAPALAASASLKSATMFDKIISIHGTYLETTEPMECGSGPLGPEETSIVHEWFERVAGWPNFRVMYPMGSWSMDVEACRIPRPASACLADLDAAGVPYEPLDHAEHVFTPVRITGPVGGVTFEAWGDLVMDCEMAARLPAFAEVLAGRDVTSVGIMSAHRPAAAYSFHAIGLALDVNWMKATHWQRALWVKTDFQKTPDDYTCDVVHSTGTSRTLVGVACDLWRSRIFSTVITPNYNEGHANHFHLDLRPGDNRFFVR